MVFDVTPIDRVDVHLPKLRRVHWSHQGKRWRMVVALGSHDQAYVETVKHHQTYVHVLRHPHNVKQKKEYIQPISMQAPRRKISITLSDILPKHVKPAKPMKAKHKAGTPSCAHQPSLQVQKRVQFAL